MDVIQHFPLCLYVLAVTFSRVLSKPSDHRNLFTQRVCCRRQSHFVYIGQDISRSPVRMDVGLCRSHCAVTARSTREESQQDSTKNSSTLEFIRSRKKKARGLAAPESSESLNPQPSCGFHQVCEPAGVRVERVHLLEGPREVEVIQECHCEVKLSQCMRVPALKTFYFETPHETVVDVGACSRSKGSPEGFTCLPTKFDSILVETPNKMELIQTVVECELKESCYRVPYVEYFYETVHLEDGRLGEKLKEIDTGRCLGGCTTGSRCLLRSPSDSKNCHLWSERQSSSCVPQTYESHTFKDKQLQIQTVHSITSCSCQH